MRLLTLNIRFGAGSEFPDKQGYDLPVKKKKITALAFAIESVKPDIVALQEVKNEKQAEQIASHLNFKYIYCRHPSSYSLDFFEWGIAFLFRLPLIKSAGFSIYFDENIRTGRQALIASFEAGDNSVTVINVHLVPNAIDRQIENLFSLTKQSDAPTILMGDFNCTPHDNALNPIKNKWVDTCQAAITTPGGAEADSRGTLLENGKRIDYIFVEKYCFIIRKVGILEERHRLVSDHIGYFADIDIR